jgi:hypothetical protein
MNIPAAANCKKCNGRGFTNEILPAGDGINVRFVPPEMVICDCARDSRPARAA